MLPAMLKSFFWDIHIPLTKEVKYTILGISVILFLVAFCILIWQVHLYCVQAPASKYTGIGSLLDSQSEKHENLQNDSKSVDYKLESCQDKTEQLSNCLIRSSELGSSTDSLGETCRERVQGSLRFLLFYDRVQSQLFVTVLAARELSRSTCLFVRVRLLWASAECEEPHLMCVLQEWQTRLVKDSCNPTFRDQFSCKLAEEEVPRVMVRFEIRDFDKYSRHGILGEVRVPLNSLKISHPLRMLEDLQKAKKDIVGEVLLSLRYMPTSQRLELGVLKVRALSQSSKTKRALYARTSVLCNQCKIRHQKTSEKIHCDVTVFNEVLIFVLPDTQIRECTIKVSVYERRPGKKSSKHLIGKASIGKEKAKEDEHWKLMMWSLRQPIAKWHLLYL
ncbi:synaptotagmin-A [Electrophorus electricus]|uniref:synaptotagmin-A n=1 Tax=Electrophorus electricus TaxID=8005 RepID=UPI0015D025FE|nr:synaptotagmin-A [Electrophorus electricus]